MTSSTDSTRETWTAAIKYITGRKNAEEALGFLSHVSALLDAMPEPDEWGRAVARVCVPYLASAVSLDVISAGPGPGSGSVARSITEPDNRFSDAVAALRTAADGIGSEPYVISEHEKFAGSSRPRPDGAPSDLVASAVVVPLVFRKRGTGQLVAVRDPQHSKGDLGPADLALITELAARLALANAYTELADGNASQVTSEIVTASG